MNKVSMILFLVFTVGVTAFLTWFLTDTHYKLKEATLVSAIQPDNPNALFEWGAIKCRPNLDDGNCSKQLEQSFLMIQDRYIEKLQYVANLGIDEIGKINRSGGSSGSHYMRTNCREDMTGNVVCDSFGY